ncbi:MAG: serine/threonine protein phosphatase, partial [Lachnospiraceae bacterium]
MVKSTTQELDASIFEDERLERRVRVRLRKLGMRVWKIMFFVTKAGRYEIHITGKSNKGICVTTGEMVQRVSEAVNRKMVLEKNERPVLGQEYCTIKCMEGPRFHTLQGVAKIGKGLDKISGDSFLMMELPGGQKGVALSDGMGSGEKAYKESTMVIELLEELLASGFPKETA